MKRNMICSEMPSVHYASSCRFPCSLCGSVMYSSQGEVHLLGGVKKRKRARGKTKPHILFPLLLRLLSVCKVHTPPGGGTATLRPGNKTPVVMMMMTEKEKKGKLSHCWLNETASLVLSVSCQGGSNERKISVCLNKPLQSVSLTFNWKEP